MHLTYFFRLGDFTHSLRNSLFACSSDTKRSRATNWKRQVRYRPQLCPRLPLDLLITQPNTPWPLLRAARRPRRRRFCWLALRSSLHHRQFRLRRVLGAIVLRQKISLSVVNADSTRQVDTRPLECSQTFLGSSSQQTLPTATACQTTIHLLVLQRQSPAERSPLPPLLRRS
jgi:hypothetical protein